MPSSVALLDAALEPVVGSKAAGALKKAFGILTVGDLLAHYPRVHRWGGSNECGLLW